MKAQLELIRPLNASMAALAVLVGALVATGAEALSGPGLSGVALAAAVAFLYTGAGNALNDYYDRHTDRINHPCRPIPSGRVRPEPARRISISLFASGMILAFFIGWPEINGPCLLIAAINAILLGAYEARLKRRGLAGNITISWLTASLFLFGGASSVSDRSAGTLSAPVLILSFLAFLASMGREIIKGIEDIEGDRDRSTLPRLLGPRRAGALASAWILTAVALSSVPVIPPAIFPSLIYIPPVLAADGTFIYSLFVLSRNPGLSSRLTKLAMLMALLAFLAGGLAVRG